MFRFSFPRRPPASGKPLSGQTSLRSKNQRDSNTKEKQRLDRVFAASAKPIGDHALYDFLSASQAFPGYARGFQRLYSSAMNISLHLAPRRARVAHPLRSLLFLGLLVLVSGCQSVKNATDRFSVDRRDVLVEHLDHTSHQLLEVHQSFSEVKTELVEFSGQVDIPLRQRHEWLGERYVRCEAAVEEADVEIKALQEAARRFFLNWESELFDYSNELIRDATRFQLNETRQRYERAITQVKKSQQLATGTLEELRDYLSFLRHNLNDQAFAALHEPGADLTIRTDELLKELATAIDATDQLSDSLRVH
jgi:hypothetical protein